MFRILQFFIRSFAFVGKELMVVLRQPRLILSLVILPFIIMLLFGLGFPDKSRTLRTTLVIEADNLFTEEVKSIAGRITSPIELQAVENNKEVALNELIRGETDLVIDVPNNPRQTIMNNQQAKFQVYHNEIDPIQAGYVQFTSRMVADIFNREILEDLTAQGQRAAGSLKSDLDIARQQTEALQSALEARDLAASLREKERLENTLDLIRLAIGSPIALISALESKLGYSSQAENPNIEEIEVILDEINRNLTTLDDLDAGSTEAEFDNKAAEIQAVETKIAQLNESITIFRSIDPAIIVSPFAEETSVISGLRFSPVNFFAPAVIVLLLQHIAITFAALSIVRDRNTGIMELFTVAPISALETLIGKYLSYFLASAFLAGIFTGLILWILDVPMLGNWLDYGLAVFVLLFSSLGFGFLISMISKTDRQRSIR